MAFSLPEIARLLVAEVDEEWGRATEGGIGFRH